MASVAPATVGVRMPQYARNPDIAGYSASPAGCVHYADSSVERRVEMD
jgi:hypothetical protein